MLNLQGSLIISLTLNLVNATYSCPFILFSSFKNIYSYLELSRKPLPLAQTTSPEFERAVLLDGRVQIVF